MSKTRRLILIFSVVQFAIGLVFALYFVNLALCLILSAIVDVILFKLIMGNVSWREVINKSIRPILFWLLSWTYYFTSTAITGTRLLSFGAFVVIATIWHAVLCHCEVTTEKMDWVASVEAVFLIFISTNIISLLIANWSLPQALLLGVYLLLNIFISLFWLARLGKNVNFLALIWGLAAAQLVWINSHWLIFYQLPVLKFLISQNSLLIVTLAYCWGGIYSHYKKSQLSRKIIMEYLFVLLIVVVVLLILTRWRVV